MLGKDHYTLKEVYVFPARSEFLWHRKSVLFFKFYYFFIIIILYTIWQEIGILLKKSIA
jgi:hypothetical protein